MKNLITLLFVLGLFIFSDSTVEAQSKTIPASPAKEATGKIGAAQISVKYSSPGVKGREIWGELVPYDEVWRAGANESTKVTTDKDLSIGGETLPAGTYSFYVIPREGKPWTAIFSKDTESWGSFDYDTGKDALRTEVEPAVSDESAERLTYRIEDGALELLWEKILISIPVDEK